MNDIGPFFVHKLVALNVKIFDVALLLRSNFGGKKQDGLPHPVIWRNMFWTNDLIST